MADEETTAERDARRAAYEAELDKQAAAHRAEHIATVSKALSDHWPVDPHEPRTYAEFAVDALMASGVVFATIGTWDEDDDTP